MKTTQRNLTLLWLVLSLCPASVLLAASAPPDFLSHTYAASTNTGELKIEATFHLWLPPRAKQIRAVIVHQHGCGDGAESFGDVAIHDLHWRALAAAHDAAYLCPHYRTTAAFDCTFWYDPRKGSAAILQRALDDFSARTGHPELASAPLCLWGHSGGGIWASFMLEQHPERIVAVFCRSGAAFGCGGVREPNYPPEAYRVPVLLNPGLLEKGNPLAWDNCVRLFETFRAKGAPVAFAPDPISKHDCRNSRLLAVPYLDACLKARLPRHGNALKPVDFTDGWAVDWEGTSRSPSPLPSPQGEGTSQGQRRDCGNGDIRLRPLHAVGPHLSPHPDPLPKGEGEPFGDQRLSNAVSWLPSKSVARAFTEYVATGITTDRTAPRQSPTLTSITRATNGVTLSWTAQADLESGIREFAIYRNGKRITTWPDKFDLQTGYKQFQGISFHDTPVTRRPPMTFTDTTTPANTRLSYSIATVNGSGLEGPRSKPRTP